MKAGLYRVSSNICLWTCVGNAHRWMMVDELVLVLGQRSGLKGFEYVIVNGEIREMAPDPIYDDDGQQKYRMSRVI